MKTHHYFLIGGSLVALYLVYANFDKIKSMFSDKDEDKSPGFDGPKDFVNAGGNLKTSTSSGLNTGRLKATPSNYRCKDASGNIYFSSTPCTSKA